MKTKELTQTAMLAALVCVCTYTFKIPTLTGYTHLGDCMIIVAVLMVGGRQGALAAAIGASTADLIGGYLHWVFPTFFIKGLMALTMAYIAFHLLRGKSYGWLVGAIIGGVVQIVGYTAAKIPMMGFYPALGTIPSITGQTLSGLLIAAVIVMALKNTQLLTQLNKAQPCNKPIN